MISSGIYQIRCLVNDHIYVGSAKNLNKRKNGHFSALNKNKHHSKYLQNAFNLYGVSNFVFEVLCEIENKERLIDWEQYFIDTLNPEYNINFIAGSSLGVKRSEETKRKIALSQIGKKIPIEVRQKIKEAMPDVNGDKNPFYGKHHTEEHKSKQSQTLSEKYKKEQIISLKGSKHPKAKFNDEQIIEIRNFVIKENKSIKDVANLFGVSYSCIELIVKLKRYKDVVYV